VRCYVADLNVHSPQAVQVTAPLTLLPSVLVTARDESAEFDPSRWARYAIPVAIVLGTGAFVNKGALKFDNAGFAERAARIGINTMLSEKNLWTLTGMAACTGYSLLWRKPDSVDDIGVTVLRAAYNGTAAGMALFFLSACIRNIAER